jgi:3',5'-cyclic AMP phosphodiesterase CpdA
VKLVTARRPFRLAHLSDLHIGPLPPLAPRDLLSKRLLGYLSWRSRKQHIHRIEVLAALERDLQASAADHVVITGDLVNLGLPAEFGLAAAWLRDLGEPDWISVVPGNHDCYLRVGENEFWTHWAEYMVSDGAATPARADSGRFPYLRRRGPLAIIGLSSAVATPPGFATGRLGSLQLAALDRLLVDLSGDACCRVVLLHHPPHAGARGWRKRLIDAAAFRTIVARRGADLILHGHEHTPVGGLIESRWGAIPVLGVPSASSLDPRPGRQAQYQIYAIARNGSGWDVRREAHGYDRASASFVAQPDSELALASSASARPC